jgi:WS/DGAT/MGAT family acyltransferase
MPAMTSGERVYLQLERDGFPFDIAGFVLLEASSEGPLPFEHVRAVFDQRYHLSPLMTRVAAPAPMGIGQDRWTNVLPLDIDQHVHHKTVPAPGDMKALLGLILELTREPLNRNRPLWDCWYLTGMADGTAALLMRIHHAGVDGMGIMQMQRVIHDMEPTPVDPTQPGPAQQPRRLPSRLRRALYEVPDRVTTEAVTTTRIVKQVGSAVPGAIKAPIRAAAGTAPKLGSLLRFKLPSTEAIHLPELPAYIPSPTGHPPSTLFNKHVSDPRKALAVTSLQLSDVKRVRLGFPDVTINDILLALVTGALRGYLAAHDELPTKPLRTTCPVNVRTSTDKAAQGVHITTTWIDLPVHLRDPGERLLTVSANATAAKDSLRQSRVFWGALEDVGDLVLPGVVGAALAFAGSGVLEVLPPTQNLTVSTVVSSGRPIYLATRKITHMFARTIVCPPINLFVSSVTYNGSVDFSITSVAQLCPDPETLADGLHAELDRLLAIAG